VFLSAIVQHLLLSDGPAARPPGGVPRTARRSSWMRIRLPAGSRREVAQVLRCGGSTGHLPDDATRRRRCLSPRRRWCRP